MVVWRSGEAVFGRPPNVLRGLMEVRGLGVGPWGVLPFAPLRLVVDLRGCGERVPEAETIELAGVPLPRLDLDPFGRSAPDRLAAALASVVRLSPARPPP